MAARMDESLLFVVEWYDPLPQLKKQYLLKYYPDQHMAEMVDVKSKKVFLKKSPCPETLSKDEFYVGSKILLYSRELDIVDYGDGKTRDRLNQQLQPCTLLLPASAYSQWGKILNELLTQQDCQLVEARTIILPANQVVKALDILEENPRLASAFPANSVSLAMNLRAENSFQRIGQCLNRFQQQTGVVGVYAHNGTQSAALSSLLQLTGTTPSQSTATLDSCTCCILKPHLVKARLTGRVLDEIIAQGYEISALRTLFFDKIQAEEFLEVYKGVIPEWADQVIQLCSGLCVALELRAENAVETFRVTAGPWDVDMARELRPDSLRGKFGEDRIRSAVHCTDLSEDAQLECEYVFKLM